MMVYVLFLVASVYLGTEFLALSMPGVQLTIYRLLGVGTIPFLALQLWRGNRQLVVNKRNAGTMMIFAYILWWLGAFISILWVKDINGWVQALFLITLGMSTAGFIYLNTMRLSDWKKLIQTTWAMMSGLVLWGYFEIITNIYIYADLKKLDKYNTFANDFWTRIPATIFENQNDFGTMLLAYLVINLILYHLCKGGRQQLIFVVTSVFGIYLIYRTGSRMSTLGILIFYGTYLLTQLRYDIPAKIVARTSLAGIMGIITIALTVPPISNAIDSVIYTGSQGYLSGDLVRVNLLRNGWLFLGTTFGFGVGAGNIEYWMEHYAYLPLDGITNMHHWWFEILVGYGLIPFLGYVLAYALMMYQLWQIRQQTTNYHRQIASGLFSFMVVFIFASTTSANNILVEWHWVFFGVIIAYLKIADDALRTLHTTNFKKQVLS